MTVVVNAFNGWCPEGLSTQLPPVALVPLQASAQGGQGQLLVYDASGNVALADGTVPGLIAAGVVYPDKLTSTSTTAGLATTYAYTGIGSGAPASTVALDTFTAADVCTPCFAKDESTLGKKSNNAGLNRPFMGLVFGVAADGTPRAWIGPVAQAVGRGVLIANNFPLGQFGVADAAASTTMAERAIRRPKIKGTVTDVTFTGAAITGDNTNYATITIAKRGLADAYAAATTIATYDTRITGQSTIAALTPTAMVLSVVAGALNLLETDIVTIVTTKGGSGQTLTGEFLVNGKAL